MKKIIYFTLILCKKFIYFIKRLQYPTVATSILNESRTTTSFLQFLELLRITRNCHFDSYENSFQLCVPQNSQKWSYYFLCENQTFPSTHHEQESPTLSICHGLSYFQSGARSILLTIPALKEQLNSFTAVSRKVVATRQFRKATWDMKQSNFLLYLQTYIYDAS